MKPNRYVGLLILFCLFSLPLCARAAGLPRIGYVYPAGGRQGAVFEAEVGGQRLDGVYDVLVTGGGVKGRALEHILPETPQRIKALQEICDADSPVKTTLKKIVKTLKQQPNVQIEETVRLQLTIAGDAPPGLRELRLITPAGISDPLVFYVGNLPEYREEEPNDAEPKDAALSPPLVINGQIMPGDVDRFRITAKKGQSLVLETKARDLMPYLADAVPGWFQAVTTLYDARGREVACADQYQFNPDPVLFYDVLEDGEYILEVRDALYRGREDFVYRVAVGEQPFITGHFPLGGPAGSRIPVELSGKNLPVANFTVDTGNGVSCTYFDLKNKQGLVSNRIRFDVDTLPEVFEFEPNNTRQQARLVTLPVIINGRIQAPGDWDVFSFTGRAGQEIAAEVIARRLNSPLDSILQLLDSSGKVLQVNDDYEDKGFGLLTHQADSYLTCKLPADGTYLVRLGDIQGKGGNQYAYRLRLGPERPDFELRTVPSGITMPAGGSAVITVYALRKDGFDGAIKLSVGGGGAGAFTFNDAGLAAKEEKANLTISASAEVPPGIFFPRITGTAVIQGRECQRQAVPADDMMQAFSYRHLVPAERLFILLTAPAAFTLSTDVISGNRIRIPKNGSTAIMVDVVRRSTDVRGIRLDLKDPPQGITMMPAGIWGKALSVKVTVKADKSASVGLKGNLILTGTTRLANQAYVITAPAIPFEIVD